MSRFRFIEISLRRSPSTAPSSSMIWRMRLTSSSLRSPTFLLGINAGPEENGDRPGPPDSVNVSETDRRPLLHREVDTCYARHKKPPAIPDVACASGWCRLPGPPRGGGSPCTCRRSSSLMPVLSYGSHPFPRSFTIRPRVLSCGESSTKTLSFTRTRTKLAGVRAGRVRDHLRTALQLHPAGRVRQQLDHRGHHALARLVPAIRHGLVSTHGPSVVTATQCSKCAE